MPTKPTKILTLDDIRSASDLGEKTIDVPEWGGSVRVRGLTMEEARDIQRKATVDGEIDEARVVMLTVATGLIEPALDESEMYALNQKKAGVVLRLCIAVNSLTGASPAEVAAAEASFR